MENFSYNYNYIDDYSIRNNESIYDNDTRYNFESNDFECFLNFEKNDSFQSCNKSSSNESKEIELLPRSDINRNIVLNKFNKQDDNLTINTDENSILFGIMKDNFENENKKTNKRNLKKMESMHRNKTKSPEEVKKNLSTKDSISCINELSLIENENNANNSLLEKKIEKLKMLEQKRRSSLENNNDQNLNNLIEKIKEEIKAEKNRLSAKRSRDMAKIKMQTLEKEVDSLKNENASLISRNDKFKNILKKIDIYLSNSSCKKCSSSYPTSCIYREINSVTNDSINHSSPLYASTDGYSTNSTNEGSNNYNISNNSQNSSRFGSLSKISFFVGIVMIICMLGMNNNINSNANLPISKRVLSANNVLEVSNNGGYLNKKESEISTKPFKTLEFEETNRLETIKEINKVISKNIEGGNKPKLYFQTNKEPKVNTTIVLDQFEQKNYHEILK